MASIGHALVGLAVARGTIARGAPGTSDARRRIGAALVFPALALSPDLDVIAFAFGVPYSAPFGHRGASHAILTAVVLGLVLAVPLARALRTSVGVAAIAGVIALGSHGLLDALTDGGEGVALLWPFTNERFFAPLQPIPVAPIGLGFLSQRGLLVAATELVMFSPFLLYALWRRASKPGQRRGVRPP